jgi:hypothetical protein
MLPPEGSDRKLKDGIHDSEIAENPNIGIKKTIFNKEKFYGQSDAGNPMALTQLRYSPIPRVTPLTLFEPSRFLSRLQVRKGSR